MLAVFIKSANIKSLIKTAIPTASTSTPQLPLKESSKDFQPANALYKPSGSHEEETVSGSFVLSSKEKALLVRKWEQILQKEQQNVSTKNPKIDVSRKQADVLSLIVTTTKKIR